MRFAAFNTGSDIHLLDHIAPLAALFDCPLFVTEEHNFTLAERYYPQVKTHYLPDLERHLGTIAQHFDALLECKYWQPHLKELFRTLYGKEMRLIFCPHGQSDKGYEAPLLAPYALQDAILCYGPLLLDMLKELQIQIPPYTVVGNYRLGFYQKYRTFYDGLMPFFDRSKKTLLYAPTWNDLDQASSFFSYSEQVIAELPGDWNLIIKPHPLLKLREPHRYELLKRERSNVWWVEDFPPVYPLLARADCYLGDASSIGYDFLYFDKPLYFFPSKIRGRLHACGTILDPQKNLYLQMEAPSLSSKRQELYQYAFGDQSPTGAMIQSVCRSLK